MSDMLNEKFEEFVTEQKVIVSWRSYANCFCKRYSWHW